MSTKPGATTRPLASMVRPARSSTSPTATTRPSRLGAPAAWTATRGRGVAVAILDSGVDSSHEDLKGRIVASVDCVGASGDPGRCHAAGSDDDGHGTHVAGIIGATAGNGVGTA